MNKTKKIILESIIVLFIITIIGLIFYGTKLTKKPAPVVEEKKVAQSIETTEEKEVTEIKDCEKLSESTKKEKCILELALKKEDPEICDDEYCKNKYAFIKGEEGKCEICENFQDEKMKYLCFLGTAIKNNFKEFCKNNSLKDFFVKYEYNDLGFSIFLPTKLFPWLDFELSRIEPLKKSINLSEENENNRSWLSKKIKEFVNPHLASGLILTFIPIKFENSYIHDAYYHPRSGYERKSYFYFDPVNKNCKLYLIEDDYEQRGGFEINGVPLYSDILAEKNLPISEENLKKFFPSGNFLKPDFYTLDGSPVFSLPIVFVHDNIVCLYPHGFLIVSPNSPTEVSNELIDLITKTIAKLDSEIDESGIEKALIDVLKEGIKESGVINP
jgi:hypothetical protein